MIGLDACHAPDKSFRYVRLSSRSCICFDFFIL